jgi:glycosyltransferase involved in cell wall biosynthesis
MKRVLHIIDFFGIGGAEKLVLSVINGLADSVEQHLIILSEPAPLLSDINVPCKTTVLDFKSYRDVWKTKKFIREYIKENKIDIVHSQLYWSNIIARMSSGRNVKVFNTIQAISSEASYKINRTTLYLEKLTYKKRHHIIGVSGEVLKDFDKWVGLKGASTVLYNIIDEKFIAREPKTEFSKDGLKLVAVGNLRWQKNYPYLIEAFKGLPPSVTLDIYGEGDLRNQLQKDIDKHKLNIRLCGHHHNLHEILPQYDVFVMCSLYEGFSLGLMEAMASGLPPVLSDVPVLKEAGGDAAVYVDLNKPEDFAATILRLEKNKNELAAIAKAAHARAIALADKKNHLKNLMNLYGVPERQLSPVT